VIQHRRMLVAELPVYGCGDNAAGEITSTAGIADAVAIDGQGKVIYVLDWKSNVHPSPANIQHHAGQLRIYLNLLGASKGALIYLTTGQVVEVSAELAAAKSV